MPPSSGRCRRRTRGPGRGLRRRAGVRGAPVRPPDGAGFWKSLLGRKLPKPDRGVNDETRCPGVPLPGTGSGQGR